MNDSIVPDAEALRRAVRWISDQRLREPPQSQLELIDEAGRRFDLTPNECEFLLRMLREDSASAPSNLP